MASYNRVVLLGNLTRDPELRYTAGGTPVCEIGMAMNDRRKGPQGEWVEETVFVDVTLWGRTAEVASEYLSKGSPLFVEGRLKFDSWEGNDGQRRTKLRVVCERMQLLGGRGGGGGGGGGGEGGGEGRPRQAQRPAGRPQQQGQAARSNAEPPMEDFEPPAGPPDEDIPF